MTTSTREPARGRKLASNAPSCPECGSANVQKSSAVFEQGTRLNEGRSNGAFITSRGTFGVGASHSKGRSWSLATERNSPPEFGPPFKALVAAFGSGALVLVLGLAIESPLLSASSIFVMFGVMIYFAAPSDAETDERQLWEMQWYCRKCGATFVPEDVAKAHLAERARVAALPDHEKPRRNWWQRTFGG